MEKPKKFTLQGESNKKKLQSGKTKLVYITGRKDIFTLLSIQLKFTFLFNHTIFK
jgi:hypothetical protein